VDVVLRQLPEGWAVFVGADPEPIVFAELEAATSCMLDWLAFDPVVIPASLGIARTNVQDA
jgi:hypothetical protein